MFVNLKPSGQRASMPTGLKEDWVIREKNTRADWTDLPRARRCSRMTSDTPRFGHAVMKHRTGPSTHVKAVQLHRPGVETNGNQQI